MSRPRVARVLLVGFMGSGKSSVGAVVAERLGWELIDVDKRLEAELGLSVAEVFATLGEEVFRTTEARMTADALEGEQVVIAAGGGWAAVQGRLEGAPDGTMSVWLDVSPEEALRRVGTQPGTRPLLSVPDATAVAIDLLERRAPFYARADVKVDTDGVSVEDVSARILDVVLGKDPKPDAE